MDHINDRGQDRHVNSHGNTASAENKERARFSRTRCDTAHEMSRARTASASSSRTAHEIELMRELDRYIQEHWIAPDRVESGWTQEEAGEQDEESLSKAGVVFSDLGGALSLDDLIGDVGKTFHEVLFEKIAQSGMTDVEVYKRANMDRKLFSKIRSNPAYHPRKNTVLALAIALKMDIEETQDLLSRAEYALSPSSKSDVIIRYFIERRIYDIHLINIALDDYGQAILE